MKKFKQQQERELPVLPWFWLSHYAFYINFQLHSNL